MQESQVSSHSLRPLCGTLTRISAPSGHSDRSQSPVKDVTDLKQNQGTGEATGSLVLE